MRHNEWVNGRLSGNASAVSDAPRNRWAGRFGKSGPVPYSCLKEAVRGWEDSMEFESSLVSKALPDREFRRNPFADAHRYMTSMQPYACQLFD